MGIRQDAFLDYDGFCDKFKPRKTTDDCCYTPPNIYEVVREWAVLEYNLAGREIVRPFWPGGDYEAYHYPPGCVVIDNPPFSMVSKICKFYLAQGVDFFLFSPYLINFGIGSGDKRIRHVIAPCSVTYENGARVDTCFVTNMGNAFIRNAPDLMDAIQAAEDANAAQRKKTLPKYEYPDAVITSARVGWFCKHHTPYAVGAEDCAFIRALDAQSGSGIFGGGFCCQNAPPQNVPPQNAPPQNAPPQNAPPQNAPPQNAPPLIDGNSPRAKSHCRSSSAPQLDARHICRVVLTTKYTKYTKGKTKMHNPLVTLDPIQKCPTYTLDDIQAREPDIDEWELRNDMIKRVVVASCDHGFLSLGIDYVSGKQGVGYGHRNEANIGLMICALADLLETRYRNGDALAAMANAPIRVLFRADPGGSVVESTYIGHFMKDKFIKMSEWVKCGIV